MSKMREAWKKFCATETAGPTGNFEFDLFSAGYQAAIAAIREGGPVAFEIDTNNQSFIPQRVGAWLAYDVDAFKSNMAKCLSVTSAKPLYLLPDDLT